MPGPCVRLRGAAWQSRVHGLALVGSIAQVVPVWDLGVKEEETVPPTYTLLVLLQPIPL